MVRVIGQRVEKPLTAIARSGQLGMIELRVYILGSLGSRPLCVGVGDSQRYP